MIFRDLGAGDFFMLPRKNLCIFMKIHPVKVLNKDGVVEEKNTVLFAGVYNYSDVVKNWVSQGGLLYFEASERVEPREVALRE